MEEPRVADPDFRALDFGRLWKGRETTVAVERSLVDRWLARTDARRVLELGTGNGRLTPAVWARAVEYIGVDLHAEFLEQIPWRDAPSHSLGIATDARAVPLADHSVTGVVAVRIYNFFEDPGPLLREVARVLIPGGHLLLGYQPRPSVASLLDDLRVRPHLPRPPRPPSWTGSRVPVLPGAPGPFPSWAPTRGAVRAALRRAGFEVRASTASGLEDYALFRRLPSRWFVRGADLLDRGPVAPTQWILAQTPAVDPRPDWVPWASVITCPACREPARAPPGSGPACDRHRLVRGGPSPGPGRSVSNSILEPHEV
ncbi:MAG: class I SAM-dependent methyltransferase [Thermoplasmata archaeon]|jgi:SAM-dependent methyltransferase